MSAAAEWALGVAQVRQERATYGRESEPGDRVKYSACVCGNSAHGYPDRWGWQSTQALAHDDLLKAMRTGQSAHIVRRETTVAP